MNNVISRFSRRFEHRLEAPVVRHLKHVYACLSLSTLCAAMGGFSNIYTQFVYNRCLAFFGSIAFLIALIMTPHNGSNRLSRLLYFLGFAFFSGLGLGPMLQKVAQIDSSIIVVSLFGAALIFVVLTVSALLAERKQCLRLGGFLTSALFVLLIMQLVLAFVFRLPFFLHLWLCTGFFLTCGFIIYDTQNVIEKFHMGNNDYVVGALDLFLDVSDVFRFLIVFIARGKADKTKLRECRAQRKTEL